MSNLSLRTHVPVLDGVRGLAILLVLFHHGYVINAVSPAEVVLGRFTSLGAHGVDLFFVLSGFLITSILLDSKSEPSYFRNFYARRALRIFPLYYALLAFTFVILPHLIAMVPAGAEKLDRFTAAGGHALWYWTYTSNFLIAGQEAFRHGVLDISWSLAIEEQFYLVWPLIVWLLSAVQLRRLCVALVLIALACRLGLWWYEWSWVTIYVFTPCRIDTLALGALLAVLVRSHDFRPTAWRHWLVWSAATNLAILLLLTGVGMLSYDSPLMFTFGYSLTAILSVQGILLVLSGPANGYLVWIFASSFLKFFGKYSYAIYLFHMPVRAAIRDLWFGDAQFRELPGWPLLWQLVFYAVAVAAVVPLALLSWHLLERPMLSLKRYFASEPMAPRQVEQVSSFQQNTHLYNTSHSAGSSKQQA